MSYTLKQISKMTREDLFKIFHHTLNKCMDCGKPLYRNIDEYQKIPDGLICDDCYFDRMDKAISEHPIGRPCRRGA